MIDGGDDGGDYCRHNGAPGKCESCALLCTCGHRLDQHVSRIIGTDSITGYAVRGDMGCDDCDCEAFEDQPDVRQLEADVRELAHRNGCDITFDRENGPPGEVGVVAVHPEGDDIIGSGPDDQAALEDALETLRSWGPP